MKIGLLDLLRLFALQASWNRRSMQDLGWIAAVAPHLRQIEGKEWVPRWSGFRNTHPYLAGLVLGAGVRMEMEGQGTRVPALLDAWSRMLGATGDAVFWVGLRPAVALLALAIGLSWSWHIVLFGWLSFAIVVACGLRLWAWHRGLALGERMLAALPRERQQRWIRSARWAAFTGAFCAAATVAIQTDWSTAALIALACGAFMLSRRIPVELVVLAATLALIVWPWK